MKRHTPSLYTSLVKKKNTKKSKKTLPRFLNVRFFSISLRCINFRVFTTVPECFQSLYVLPHFFFALILSISFILRVLYRALKHAFEIRDPECGIGTVVMVQVHSPSSQVYFEEIGYSRLQYRMLELSSQHELQRF